jgi:Tol biopolymer transport system component/tRNA A-37 threonylcarbamoyl transferase component Bud32
VTLTTGTRLGRYEIRSKIGEGGMGEVYLAEDTHLGRKVALKRLPDDLLSDEQARRRFAQEAKTTSALNHQHIVTIYDIASDDHHDFIAMEYVEGESLRARLVREKLNVRQAVEFAAQVASGLAAAHSASIIHRDIKPENLMVTRASRVKILDFGLAKLIEKQRTFAASDVTTAHLPAKAYETKAGAILGTVAYMSPEQAEGRVLDHRTDIFSLGVVLYEMLTGNKAFEGKSAIDTLHAIINREPRPAVEVNPRLPAEVNDILGKALAKDLNERYQHAGDFELDLRRLKRAIESNALVSLHTLHALKPQAWWPSRRAMLVGGIVGVLLLVGVLMAAWILGRASALPNPEAPAAPMALTPLTVDPGYDGEPTFSKDGQRIAYVTNRTGNFEIFLKPITGGTEINLTKNDADDVQPAFSPDGTQIAFVSTRESSSPLIYRYASFPLLGGDIWIMSELGGIAKKIVESGNFPSWSPDGAAIIYTGGPPNNMKIFRVPASGGEASEIPLKFASGDPVRNIFYPSYSSDGRWIVFEKQLGDEIYVVSAAGGEAQQVAKGRGPVWNAKSTAIIYSSGEPGKNFSLWQVPFALADGKVAGTPTPLTISRGRDVQPAVSRDGKFVAFAGQDVEFNIEKMPFDAESGRSLGNPVTVTSGHSLNYFFDAARDGQVVVFEAHRGSSNHIWSGNESGFNQLTSDDNFEDRYPKWSPDGRTIAFIRKGAGESDIKGGLWLMSALGANPQSLASGVGNFRWVPPDGRGIVYVSTQDRQFYFFDIATKSARRLTDEKGIAAMFNVSSDGQWIVYQSTLKGVTVDVRAVEISGGPSRAVVETPREDFHPFISPSGRWLYFQPDHKNLYRVPGPAQGWRQAEPEKVTNFPESGLFLEDPQISRDGRYLFYSRGSVTGDIWIMNFGK